MTQTLERTARDAITDWLDSFQNALDTGDVAAASGLFAADSYWRDLIAFTWNIVTVEGRRRLDLLDANLERVQPTVCVA